MLIKQSTLSEILIQNRNLYTPIYQRKYSWLVENCKKWIKELNSPFGDTYFLGSVVIKENEYGYSIVDGQQRLTTGIVFLLACRDFLLGLDSTKEIEVMLSFIERHILNTKDPFAKDKNFTHEVKLQLKQEDHEVFLNLMQGQKNDNVEHKIYVNYCYFLDVFKESYSQYAGTTDSLQGIRLLVSNLLNALTAENSLENNDDEHQIFESINSTGLKLTPAELIKHEMLIGRNYAEQKYFTEKFWVQFEEKLFLVRDNKTTKDYLTELFHSYLFLKTKITEEKETLYLRFVRFFKENYGKENLEQLLDEITPYAEAFSYIVNNNHPNVELRKEIKKIYVISGEAAYTFLLVVLHKLNTKEIEEEAAVSLIKILNNYLWRRMPIGCTNQGVEAELKRYLLNATSITPRTLLYFIFNLRRTSKSLAYPTDLDIFEESKHVNFVVKNSTKHLLVDIENHSRSEQIYISVDSTYLSQIMPNETNIYWEDSLGESHELILEENKNRLGNLVLSTFDLKEFEETSFDFKTAKLQEAENHIFNVNRYVCEQVEWTQTEVEENHRYLIGMFLKLYPDLRETLSDYSEEI